MYLSANRYKVEIIFQAIGGGLVKREGIWNLVFTDNNYHEFRYITGDLQLNVSFTVLNMKTDICCRLMGDVSCNCPANFKVSFNKTEIFMKSIYKPILYIDLQTYAYTKEFIIQQI